LNTRYIAVIGADTDTVKVYRLTGGARSGHPEALSIREFERRSAANRIVWRPAGERSLITDVDVYGVTIIETRFRLR
jgi:hypothetical protein